MQYCAMYEQTDLRRGRGWKEVCRAGSDEPGPHNLHQAATIPSLLPGMPALSALTFAS